MVFSLLSIDWRALVWVWRRGERGRVLRGPSASTSFCWGMVWLRAVEVMDDELSVRRATSLSTRI